MDFLKKLAIFSIIFFIVPLVYAETFNLDFLSGANFKSFPINNTKNMTAGYFFGNNFTSASHWNGSQYIDIGINDAFEIGKTYWITINDTITIALNGTKTVRDDLNKTLDGGSPGWKMPGCTYDSFNFSDDDVLKNATVVYGWNQSTGYYITEECRAGLGLWANF